MEGVHCHIMENTAVRLNAGSAANHIMEPLVLCCELAVEQLYLILTYKCGISCGSGPNGCDMTPLRIFATDLYGLILEDKWYG